MRAQSGGCPACAGRPAGAAASGAEEDRRNGAAAASGAKEARWSRATGDAGRAGSSRAAGGGEAAQPAPAWPAEVKPIPGGRIIVPTAGARPSDNPVARRWLDNSGKPAPDQEPDKKTND